MQLTPSVCPRSTLDASTVWAVGPDHTSLGSAISVLRHSLHNAPLSLCGDSEAALLAVITTVHNSQSAQRMSGTLLSDPQSL